MKVLIWIVCFFVATIINIMIGEALGFRLGYLLFYLVVSFVAKSLCSMWDKYKKRKLKKPIFDVEGNEMIDGEIRFCRKCGGRIEADSIYCLKCGKYIIRSENPNIKE